MPIDGSWSKLTLATIQNVPAVPGVYEIGTLVRNTLYLGRSAGRDLHACLASELSDPRSQIRHRDLYFRYEATALDEQRLRRLLEEYAKKHGGKHPPLNQSSKPESTKRAAPPSLRVVERRRLRAAS